MATRLAIQWGMPPGEILKKCSTRDFALFHAYYRKEPWGYKADAMLAMTITNMSGKSIKKALPLSKFME